MSTLGSGLLGGGTLGDPLAIFVGGEPQVLPYVTLESGNGDVSYHDELNVLLDEPDGFVRNTEVRYVSQARPGRHGTQTRSRFLGSSSFSLKGHIFGSDRGQARSVYGSIAAGAQSAIDQPRLLKWREPGTEDDLQSWVRLVDMEDPQWEKGAPVLKMLHHFKSDDPRAYSQTLRTVRSLPLGPVGQGMRFPAKIGGGIHFNQVISQSQVQVSNDGEVDTPPVIRIYGNVVNPKVKLMTTGEQIALNGTVGTGSYMEIDVAARTIRLNSDPVASRLGMRDPALTAWWEVPPGQHVVVLITDSQDSQAALEIDWRDARP